MRFPWEPKHKGVREGVLSAEWGASAYREARESAFKKGDFLTDFEDTKRRGLRGSFLNELESKFTLGEKYQVVGKYFRKLVYGKGRGYSAASDTLLRWLELASREGIDDAEELIRVLTKKVKTRGFPKEGVEEDYEEVE
jgi:hypothetical protein